jgi:hypothetical protein
MTDATGLNRQQLDDRIAILRDNIRQLVEQGASAAGAQNEERNAQRLEQQNLELEALLRDRMTFADK